MRGVLGRFHLQLPFPKSSKCDPLLEDTANACNNDDSCASDHSSSTISSTKLQSLPRMTSIGFKSVGILEKMKMRNRGNTVDLFSYVMRASTKGKNMNIQETTEDDFKENYVTISTVCASDSDEAPCETEDHFIELKFSPLFRHFERICYSMGSIKRKGKKLGNSLNCTNTGHRRLTEEENFYDQCLDRHCTTPDYLQAKFALYDSRMSS